MLAVLLRPPGRRVHGQLLQLLLALQGPTWAARQRARGMVVARMGRKSQSREQITRQVTARLQFATVLVVCFSGSSTSSLSLLLPVMRR